jgi:hypothetical protein
VTLSWDSRFQPR